MDDPIGEEPAGIHPPMHKMVMGRQVEKGGCCGDRPLFGLWIGISVFLCFCLLFVGLVPLVFFWQAREEWDSGNTAKAKNSLRLARISFVVALLALTGGVVGLAVRIHLNVKAIDAYDWQRYQYRSHTYGTR
ncbi:uncharacterized protein [Littorina saxatilis]|uniref:uncharacterized protein n=1 Tax=Littorina saxatilis TaxID=31220 RepID=UPI0038B46F0A